MEGITPSTAKELENKINSLTVSDKLEFKNLEIEKIEIDVTAALATYAKHHITDMLHMHVIGVALNLTDESALPGATMSVHIDGQEVFSLGTEAKMLFSSTSVAPNQKYYTYLMRNISQTRVDVTFTSSGFANPYKAIFYLLCTKTA